jgi:aryl-alcohol dehydrogenase-like predicted oxidoreductase
MQFRPLGRTGLNVSLICLGTMTWGRQNTEAEAHAQLDYALGRGINFIDAAEMYPVPPGAETHGRTEQFIGTWLKNRKDRDKIVLATKVAARGRDFEWLRGGPRLDAKNINQALDASLKRLQTDYVDLYQLHWPDRRTNTFGQFGYTHDASDDGGTPIEETLEALQAVIKAGKVRHIGVSNETPWGVMKFLQAAETKGLPRIASIQNAYNLLNRSFEIGNAEVAMREQVGLLAYSPLAMATLTGKYLNGAKPEGARLSLFTRFQRYTGAHAQPAIAAYVDLAKKHGIDPGHMALAFVNSRPFVTSTIIGATNMAQLKSNIDSIDVKLSDEVLAGIEDIYKRTGSPCP